MTTNPISEGVSFHIKRMREILKDFSTELEAMQKLEATLKEAVDRLDRGTNLVVLQTQQIEQLIKREKPKQVNTIQFVPPSPILDKVQADLELLMVENKVPPKELAK